MSRRAGGRAGRDDFAAGSGRVDACLLRGSLDGRPLRIAGLDGFCGHAARGGGEERHEREDAAARLETNLGRAASDGAALALALTENGAAFYETHGFRSLPATEAACRVRMPAPWPREPRWVDAGDPFAGVPGLRPGTADDLEALAAIHAAATAGQRLRIDRDRATWEGALARISPGPGLGRRGAEHLLVIEEGGKVTAYVLLRRTPETLRWREHGARAGSGERLVDLFWGALALARSRGVERLEGWFMPPAPAGAAFYPIARRNRGRPVVLGRALDPGLDLPRFKSEEECRIYELDAV